MNRTFCVIGVSGYSGSGKTTLISKILSELKREGLTVGVLKHTGHRLDLDREGKDTELFYRAGADFIFAHDRQQGFARYPFGAARLSEALALFPRALDLVLVEGHKDSGIPGIWLSAGGSGEAGASPRRDGVSRQTIIRDDPKCLETAMEFIRAAICRFISERPVMAGLLVGGKSRRMGTDKVLLRVGTETFVERSVRVLGTVTQRTVLLGSAEMPESLGKADRLPDAAGVAGPMAGILSAFRWAPGSTWIMSAVDMPLMNREAWEWVLGHRRPGVWAVLPLLKKGAKAETMAACYEPMISSHVEALAGRGIRTLQGLAEHPNVVTPLVPKSLAYAWKNVNTAEEWEEVLRSPKKLS